MPSKIFIPKTCRVGFQERDDTFTKKLAYVIYYDAKGILRKEKSWETWRHKVGDTQSEYNHEKREYETRPLKVDVAPYDFDNVPTSGFVLNKGHTRYSWSHFGERRTVIRIYDPRGIEFEITPENLVALLMHTDCNRREIQGELVYAWKGTELMLLPCKSEEYGAAKDYTDLQGAKVGAKDLKEGFTYVTKNQDHLVYLGRHMWYEIKNRYDYERIERVGKKQHIFCDLEGKNFQPVKSVPNLISKCVSDGCHDEYANWVDAYLKKAVSSKVVRWETEPLADEEWERDWDSREWSESRLRAAMRDSDGKFISVAIGQHVEYPRGRWGYGYGRPEGPPQKWLVFNRNDKFNDDGSCRYEGGGSLYMGMGNEHNKVEDRSVFFHLYAIYENGLREKRS